MTILLTSYSLVCYSIFPIHAGGNIAHLDFRRERHFKDTERGRLIIYAPYSCPN